MIYTCLKPYLGVACSHVCAIDFEHETAHTTMRYRPSNESECHQCRVQASAPDDHRLCYQQYFSNC